MRISVWEARFRAKKGSLVHVTRYFTVVTTQLMGHLFWFSLSNHSLGIVLSRGPDTVDNLSLCPPCQTLTIFHLTEISQHCQVGIILLSIWQKWKSRHLPKMWQLVSAWAKASSLPASAPHCLSCHCDSMNTEALISRLPFTLSSSSRSAPPKPSHAQQSVTHFHTQKASTRFSLSSLKVKR